MNVACSYGEVSMPLFPGIPLTVLDNVPVTIVDPLPPKLTLPPDHPECVARYAQYLKDKYERMSTLPDGDWPPSLGRQYTRLAMIERDRKLHSTDSEATMMRDCVRGNIDKIIKRKKAIKLPEIFLPTEDGRQQLKILMDGAPGVGKSTLSRKICKDWASGKLLQQYHLVILLPLRQPSIKEATSIEGLIQADDLDLQKKVVQHIRRTSGELVMLIVDGYDELSYHNRTNKNLLFLDIVQGNQFPKCSVLVTSRPYASGYLQHLQSINRHVEVLGFTEKQIERCIRVHRNIPDKFKTELVEALKKRQDIASLCYIPLNCAIVLCVYEIEQFTIPNNLTKLYEIFILNSIKRRNDSITTMAEIPESVQKHLDALSKLAYDGLVADKMVFSVKDISTAFSNCHDLDESINLLSLMTVFNAYTCTSEESSYHFLHLTIQEFLAARWAASQLSDGKLLKIFQEHLREERYRMVLLFLAGNSQLKFPFAEDLFRETLDFKDPDSRDYSNGEVVDHFLFLTHLIYESQNFGLFHNLASAVEGAELFAAWYHMSPFDCLVLSHFLACDCSLKLLNLSNCGLTSESLEIMHKVNLEHCGTTQIEEVDFSSNTKMITKLSLLPELPMFEHTKVFKACGLHFPVEVSCVVDLLCLLKMRYLTTLKVSVKEYFSPLDTIYLSLDQFWFENGNIDSQSACGIFESLQHNTSLKKLNLSGNSQLAEDDSEAVGCAIEKMLTVNKTLKVLNLSGCELDTAVTRSIFSSLQHNSSLEKLDLSENSQRAEGDSEAVGCAIERMLTVNKTLKRLNLSGCELHTAVATSIFRSLQHNTSLEELDLSENHQLGKSEGVGCEIERMLKVNKKLKVLNLSDCILDTAVATSIFSSLEANTSLEELDLSENSQLTESDSEIVGCAIEGMLNVNRTLKVLNLSDCQVTDPIVEHILTGLTKNTSLVTLNIGSCTLTASCAVCLLQQMTTNSTLSIIVGIHGVGMVEMEKLGTVSCVTSDTSPETCVEFFRALNDRSIKISKLKVMNLTNQTAEDFAMGLAKNKSVQALVLRNNNIGSTGAVSMFRSLEHNTSLEKLDLSGNSQLAEGDSEAVGCAIERMLTMKRTLKVLNLSYCGIDTTLITHIAAGLAHNAFLVELNIGMYFWSKSSIISEGWVHLFKALCNNTSLERLDISYNKLEMKGSVALADLLSCNKSLAELNLGWCGIPEAGLIEIVTRGLLHNTSLEKLHISGNKLGMKGSEALADVLSCNKSLTELNLGRCDIPGLREIARGLLQNTTLQTLQLLLPQQKVFLEAEIERLKKKWKLHTPELKQT